MQAIEQVAPEVASLDFLLEVLQGGGDDADLDTCGVVCAQTRDLATVEKAQQPDLGFRRQVADLVDEQRRAVGQLQTTLAVALRVGECSTNVAEEFVIDLVLRHPGHEERLEFTALPRGTSGDPEIMDRPGEELFSGAGLPRDQDRDLRQPFRISRTPGDGHVAHPDPGRRVPLKAQPGVDVGALCQTRATRRHFETVFGVAPDHLDRGGASHVETIVYPCQRVNTLWAWDGILALRGKLQRGSASESDTEQESETATESDPDS